MKILVTGAKGMLGQDLCPTLEDKGHELIEADIHNFDITDKKNSEDFILDKKPDLIIHLAAYTNVNLAEDEPKKAELINVAGSKNIAMCANKLDIPIIGISTDYVFDGKKTTPYLPKDKPNPINVYGKTKYMGEIEIQKNCKKHYIVRTSWLYGVHGKNFVDTMIKMKDKDIIKVVNDQIGAPTWTIDLSDSLLKVLDMPYGIYHMSGGGKPVSWYGFAKTIFELLNINANLIAVSSKEYPTIAKRPKYSYMDNSKFLRNWKLALKDYLNLTQ